MIREQQLLSREAFPLAAAVGCGRQLDRRRTLTASRSCTARPRPLPPPRSHTVPNSINVHVRGPLASETNIPSGIGGLSSYIYLNGLNGVPLPRSDHSAILVYKARNNQRPDKHSYKRFA